MAVAAHPSEGMRCAAEGRPARPETSKYIGFLFLATRGSEATAGCLRWIERGVGGCRLHDRIQVSERRDGHEAAEEMHVGPMACCVLHGAGSSVRCTSARCTWRAACCTVSALGMQHGMQACKHAVAPECSCCPVAEGVRSPAFGLRAH
jgi:hypothetical protein